MTNDTPQYTGPYEILDNSHLPLPPRKYGQAPIDESHIIRLAIEGLRNKTYKNYSHAARSLEHMARKVGLTTSRVDRLQRKISNAWKCANRIIS